MDGPEYGAFELSQLARELETELAATQKLLREEREHFADMLEQRDAMTKERDEWADKCLSNEFRLVCAKAENVDHEVDYLAIWKLVKQPNENVVDAVKRVVKERDTEREKVAKLRKVVNHSPNCDRTLTVWKPCDCGLDEVMDETK